MPDNLNSLRILVISLLIGTLTACAAPTPPFLTETPIPSVEALPTRTPSPSPTETPSPSPTAVRTPPALPEVYISGHLNPIDVPRIYIEETCEYLKNRWDPNNAAPGTVVMIIMINDVNKGSRQTSSDSITKGQFFRTIENIKEQGFEAINTEQLADFLESNKKIPPRSILLLQEGRRYGGNYEVLFRPFWDSWGWPVVNGWIIQEFTDDIHCATRCIAGSGCVPIVWEFEIIAVA